MTDVEAPFELRKVVLRFTRAPSGGITEDSDAMTFHLAKITSGAIDDNWLTADYTAVEARIDTWWTTMKARATNIYTFAEIRWYKDGPVFSPADRADGPSNPATRSVTRAVVGTSGGFALPPQIAVTLTKVVSVRKRWGRLYMPWLNTFTPDVDANGRIATPSNYLTPWVTLFNGLRADGKRPVVFSRGRSAYTTHAGTAVPAHTATAYEISELRVDNNPDVMRSRRWSLPTVRSATVLT